MSVDRQKGLVDSKIMNTARIAQIGVSRGLSFTEAMTSMGVGAWHLFDPQVVDPDNVGQSSFQLQDIGKPKVDVAHERLLKLRKAAQVVTFHGKAEDYPSLRQTLSNASLVKIGIDNLASQFALADLCHEIGTPALVAGTTGDNRQYFIACVHPHGPGLKAILPAAWEGLQNGYKPPDFFPSARMYAERVNLAAVEIAVGLLHHFAGSQLRVAEIGMAILKKPLVVGLNGIHGDLFGPAQFCAA